jgi:3-oxoacyl-[acyl-carrier-protein] synthase-3
MAYSNLNNIQIEGIHTILSKNRETNDELFDVNSAREFKEKMGIYQRYVAEETNNPILNFAAQGITNLMGELSWNNDSINLVVFVTQSPDKAFPSLSNRIHGIFGFESSCVCMDINIGCSGYVHGLNLVYSLLQNSHLKHGRALLCVGDISTTFISKQNKSNRAIFSDGISVTAVEKTNVISESFFNLETFGSGHNAIHTVKKNLGEEMVMNGLEVFEYAVNYVPKNVNDLLKFSKIDIEKIDFLVLHQANKLINGFIERTLNFTKEQSLTSLELLGNTSSASIPFSIVLNKSKLSENSLLLMSGFGVGFSVASSIVKLSKKCQLSSSVYES